MQKFNDFTEAKSEEQGRKDMMDKYRSKEALVKLRMNKEMIILVADVIAGLDIGGSVKKSIAEKFATAFSSTNPAFKAGTFMSTYKKSPGWSEE